MLPIERQNRIKELIQVKHNMKISELSKELCVSEMTVHRDLKPLIDAGIVIKTFGGISLVTEYPHKEMPKDACVYCSRNIDDKLAYRLVRSNNTIEMACCAHCGLLRHRQLEDEEVQAICHDFLKQTTISAPLAWYIMDTTLHIACCQPQVLTFEWKEHAEKFVKGFGGNIYRFHEAQDNVFQQMNESHCKHH